MSLPGWRDWLFSSKTFAAAMLAVYLGLLMSLPRPYWAMATVYICSQPLSGATSSKAVYRVVGTLVGAVAAVTMVPNLVNAPGLLVGALTLWIAACLFVSLLDRTPRSYATMLAGYTAALIGFPAVTDPGAIFDTALARVEEITLGIVCAALVSRLVFPQSVGRVIAAKANSWMGDAAQITLGILGGDNDHATTRRGLVQLSGHAAEIDTLATHLRYEPSRGRDTGLLVEALRLRMLAILPVLSSIDDRLAMLRQDGTALPPPLPALLGQLRGWIRPGPPSLDDDARLRETVGANRLRAALRDAEPPIDTASNWRDVVVASLLIRLRELVDLASDGRALRRSMATGTGLKGPLAFRSEAGISAAHHRDASMALLSALAVAIAVVLTSAIWIGTGWPDGSAAPMMAAVACCFFAAQDDPVPAILQFANWTGVAVALMAVYQFAVFPLVHDFEILVLVLAPLFLVVGTLISMPATTGRGLAIAANGATVLALQSTYGADFQSYVNSNLALLLGMYAGAIVMRLTRSVGAEWAIWRLIGSARGTIARAAERRGAEDRARFAGLMLDRLGLIAPRLAALEAGNSLRDRDFLAHIRAGLNVIDLRRARAAAPAAVQASIDALLAAVARTYRARQPDPELAARIDQALAVVLAAPAGSWKRDALLGLVGLRRSAFPDAPPFDMARIENASHRLEPSAA